MLDPELAFSFTNTVGLAAWAALALSLFVAKIRRFVWPATQFVIPLVWAVLYVILTVPGLPLPDGSFTSIGGIRGLFADDSALTAGWIHFLAFDMFIGTWIARDSVERGVHAVLVLPCLALTLLFGPAGLLLYFLMRLAFGRRARTETES